MSVRILRTDLSVSPVNHKFGMLVSRNASRDRDGLSLRCGASGCSLVSGTFDLPAAAGVASDMLILAHKSTSDQTRGKLSRLSRVVPLGVERTYFS